MSVRNDAVLKTINDVRQFWEQNPLWTGESLHQLGTREFFEEHRQVIITDCFAGAIDQRIFPERTKDKKVLDLGCGPGFWTVELALRGYKYITAADLTHNALILTRKRCMLYDVSANFSQQNAEQLAFKDASFAHVNCQGVIHHTLDTEGCIREIARVLEEGGTASISVYYRGIVLQAWPLFKWLGALLAKMGVGMKGRGREKMCMAGSVDEIVRLYDGQENPIGKSYTRQEFVQMLSPYFEVQEIFLHLFPMRMLPCKIPTQIHRLLDRSVGFLMYANVKKR